MDRSKLGFNLPTLQSILSDAGYSSREAKTLADKLLLWRRSLGDEKFVSKMKELREWYINYIGGTNLVPPWWAHTKAGLPKDPLIRKMFDFPLERALLALSVSTLIPLAKEPTQAQIEKFTRTLKGNGRQDQRLKEHLGMVWKHAKSGYRKFTTSDHTGRKTPWPVRRYNHSFVPLTVPGPDCIQSPSISIGEREVMRVNLDNPKQVAQAYIKQWENLPKPAFDLLDREDKLDWLPEKLTGPYFHINGIGAEQVGNIGMIQEEEYKLRSVANVMKIAQALSGPLFTLWREEVERLTNSSTFDRSRGILWVQMMLRRGVTLASVDMTAATDLLDMDMCIDFVNYTYFQDLASSELYDSYLRFFREVSRSPFWCEELGQFVRWEQGQPLGLIDSFMLLDLTNHAFGRLACRMSGIPEGNFYCHGDDLIIDSRAFEEYVSLVEAFGGEINRSKTIISSKVAEFDGAIITADRSCNKRVYLGEISDDSFMNYAYWYHGDVRKYMKPRQRKVYDQLKFVPGVVYGEPYSNDGYGYPLSSRVEWWESVLTRFNTDRELDKSWGESLYELQLAADLTEEALASIPWPIWNRDYQSRVHPRRYSGDPRRWSRDGKTLLESLEEFISSPSFIPFEEWFQETLC